MSPVGLTPSTTFGIGMTIVSSVLKLWNQTGSDVVAGDLMALELNAANTAVDPGQIKNWR